MDLKTQYRECSTVLQSVADKHSANKLTAELNREVCRGKCANYQDRKLVQSAVTRWGESLGY